MRSAARQPRCVQDRQQPRSYEHCCEYAFPPARGRGYIRAEVDQRKDNDGRRRDEEQGSETIEQSRVVFEQRINSGRHRRRPVLRLLHR